LRKGGWDAPRPCQVEVFRCLRWEGDNGQPGQERVKKRCRSVEQMSTASETTVEADVSECMKVTTSDESMMMTGPWRCPGNDYIIDCQLANSCEE
jgi:hypothetical protein